MAPETIREATRTVAGFGAGQRKAAAVRSADSAEPASSERGARAGLSKALIVSILALAGLAYRRLLFWDPSPHVLPRTEGWFFLASDTVPQVVFAIVAFLLYRSRDRIAAALGDAGSPLLAAPLLVSGVLLFLWGHYVAAMDLVLASLLPLSLGAARLLYGRRFARAIALPVLLLAFAIPLPAVVTHQIIFPLQLWTASHTTWLLNAVGIPADLAGDMIYLADSTFEVIETCSGLRSIELLTMAAVAWVCFFRVSPWHAALLVASAPAIAYVVNLARALSLVVNPLSDLSAMHSLQGVILFLGGLVILSAVDSGLRRICPGSRLSAAETRAVAVLHHAQSARRRRAIALAAVLAALVGASLWIPQWSPRDADTLPPILPVEIEGWRMGPMLRLDRSFLSSVKFSDHQFRRYRRDGESVTVFLGYGDRLRRDRSLISPKNAFPGRGWYVEEQSSLELEAGDFRVTSVQMRSGATRILSYFGYAGTENLAGEILRTALATDQSLLRRRGGAWVLRLTTEVGGSRDGRAEAEARLRLFLDRLEPPQ